MNKAELREKIKSLARSSYLEIRGGKNLIINKFPTLEDILTDLMTDQYNLFIKDILWVAPKPTTFRVNFINGQFIFLTHSERSWMAQLKGKKYYLLNLPEEQNAIEAISRILRYGNPETTNNVVQSQSNKISNSSSPLDSIPAEEIPPIEEVPPAEEL